MSPTLRSTLLALLLAAPALATVTDQRHETFPLTAGGTVAISNINGSITIEAWDRDEVQLDATLSARSQADLDRIRIEISATGNRVEVETDYESSRLHSTSGEVDYTIKVPRGAELDGIESVNGRVEIRGVEGGVKASTVNGRLALADVAGSIEAETVNGRLELELADTSGCESISTSAVNGSIRLQLPGGAGLAVDVDTVHGDIDSDLGLEIDEPRHGPGRSMKGVVGSGRTRLEVETVNGDIEIRTR